MAEQKSSAAAEPPSTTDAHDRAGKRVGAGGLLQRRVRPAPPGVGTPHAAGVRLSALSIPLTDLASPAALRTGELDSVRDVLTRPFGYGLANRGSD